MADKKYYWLKLQKDFFERDEIKIIESMPNGKDYVLFYLKLLCKCLDQDGFLRMSDSIPYSETMLSTITNTNVDVVRSAIKIFAEFKMLEVFDGGVLYMTEVQKMVGISVQDEHTREATRNRVRAFREREKQKNLISNRYCNVSCNGEIEIEKDIEKEKEKETKKKKSVTFVPPSVGEVREYCRSVGSRVDPEAFVAFYESKGWLVGNAKMKCWKAAIVTWEKRNHLERVKPTTITAQKPNETTTTQNIDLWND